MDQSDINDFNKLNSDEIYIPPYSSNFLNKGDKVNIELPDRSTKTMTVKGVYTSSETISAYMPTNGIIVPDDFFDSLTSYPVTVVANIDESRLETVKSQLSSKFTDSAIITSNDFENVLNGTIKSLFLFIVSISSLALLAGIILIINVVGLAIILRHREIGILKAVGYTGRQVLQTYLLEYGFFGLLGGIFSIIGTYFAVMVVNQLQPQAEMVFSLPISIIMVIVSVFISLASTYFVARRTLQIKPMEILRSDFE